MRAGLSPRRSRDGSLGRLSGRSNCLIAAHGRLRGLQALRNSLPHRLPEHPCVPWCGNHPQYGSRILVPVTSANTRHQAIVRIFHPCGFKVQRGTHSLFFYDCIFYDCIHAPSGDPHCYSRSHVQQGGGEPEGFPRVGLSLLIFVLSLLAKAIIANLQKKTAIAVLIVMGRLACKSITTWPYQLALSTGPINWPYQLALSTTGIIHY
jgi:hypothetical protein